MSRKISIHLWHWSCELVRILALLKALSARFFCSLPHRIVMLRGQSLHSDGSLWAFPFPFVTVSHTGCSKSQLGFFLRVFNSSHTCVSFIFFPYSKLPTFKGVCAFKIFPNSSFLLASLPTPTPMLNPPVSSHQALVYIKQTLKLFLFQHFTEAFTFKIKALNPMNISCRTCLSSHLSDR